MGHARDADVLLEVPRDELWSVVGDDPRLDPGVLLFGTLQDDLDLGFGHRRP